MQNALVLLRGLGPWCAWDLIGGLLVASMVIAGGGARVVASHWFYGPIFRRGALRVVGALPTAVAAGLLAGPGVPPSCVPTRPSRSATGAAGPCPSW